MKTELFDSLVVTLFLTEIFIDTFLVKTVKQGPLLFCFKSGYSEDEGSLIPRLSNSDT